MLKKITIILFSVIVIPMAAYTALLWQNNRTAPPPTRQDIVASWEKSVSWLVKNRESVIQERNPILWWMVGESAKSTGDPRLQSLFDEFRSSMIAYEPNSLWHAFFVPERYWGSSYSETDISNLADYHQYFLYTLTCSRQLSRIPVVQAQNQTDFCTKTHPLGPACTTHQLMGFRFAQRGGCTQVENLPDKIAVLQNTVVRQLSLDPRVVDVYLQRVSLLIDSGAAARVQPRWLQRVIAAQLADGSWSSLQPLLPLGAGRYFGFNEKLLGIGELQGNFHTTAQGVWLLSLLQQEANYRTLPATSTNGLPPSAAPL